MKHQWLIKHLKAVNARRSEL